MRILSLISMLLFSGYAMACSCFYTPMSAKKIMQSDLMIEGKVIGKVEDGYNYKYTVRVKDVIKGKIPVKTITVMSAISSAACGVNLRPNEVYYLYIYGKGGSYSTNLCSNNQMKSASSKRYKNIIRQFKKDKKNTIWSDEQCQLVGEGRIINESAEGSWKFYHPDGSMESEGMYKNGQKVGMWKEYQNRKYSMELWARLTDEQKAIVKNKENILVRILNYADGNIENSEILFD